MHKGSVEFSCVAPHVFAEEGIGIRKSVEIPRIDTLHVEVRLGGAVHGLEVSSPVRIEELLELEKEFGGTPTDAPSPVWIVVVLVIDFPQNDGAGVVVGGEFEDLGFVFRQVVAVVVGIEGVPASVFGIHVDALVEVYLASSGIDVGEIQAGGCREIRAPFAPVVTAKPRDAGRETRPFHRQPVVVVEAGRLASRETVAFTGRSSPAIDHGFLVGHDIVVRPVGNEKGGLGSRWSVLGRQSRVRCRTRNVLLDLAAIEHQGGGHDSTARESVEGDGIGTDGGEFLEDPRNKVLEMGGVVVFTAVIPRIALRFVKGDAEGTAVFLRFAEGLPRDLLVALGASEHEPDHVAGIRIDSVQDHDQAALFVGGAVSCRTARGTHDLRVRVVGTLADESVPTAEFPGLRAVLVGAPPEAAQVGQCFLGERI